MSDIEQIYAAACESAEYTDDGFNWVWGEMPLETKAGFLTLASHLRRKHRQEFLDEIKMLIEADDQDHPFPPMVYGYAPNGEMVVHVDRIFDLGEAE